MVTGQAITVCQVWRRRHTLFILYFFWFASLCVAGGTVSEQIYAVKLQDSDIRD